MFGHDLPDAGDGEGGDSVIQSERRGGYIKAFLVSVNDEKQCVAGVGGNGVLNVIVNWVGKSLQEDIFMHVGGLDSATGELLRWQMPNIDVGDEIKIRVVETDEVEPPPKRYPDDWDGAAEE